MTQLKPQDIERKLTEHPASPPPPGLLERIQAEIPEASDHGSERAEPIAGPRRWLIAASVVIAVGGGLLGYRTLQEADVDRLALESIEPENPATDARQDDETEPPAESLSVARELHESGLSLGYLDGGKDDSRRPAVAAPPEVIGAPARDAGSVAPPAARKTIPIPDPMPEPAAVDEVLITTESTSPIPDESRSSAAATPAPEMELRRRLSQIKMPKPTAQVAPTAARDADILFGIPKQERIPPSTGGTHEPNDQPYGDVFYREYGVNPFIDTEDDRFSTFGLDVDTGSYSITRRYLDDGNLPPREAIRIEEFLNYFDYRDAPPERGDFALHADLAPAPFAAGERYHVLRFGIRGRVVADEDRKPATLIFVVDVSGSMSREDRLGLVIRSLELLLDQLRSDDRVGLVVYGSSGRVLLEPTGDLEAIRRAVQRLESGGSTNAEEGLLLAYEQASSFYRDGAINRIVLCSDGVANVGRTGPESILERVRREAERGIELTTVGFGMGNYNDVLMEQLADRGNGSYAYVDDLAEAKRIFVESLTGTLQTIAGDAKVQVVFNPDVVSRYRLLGYENRDIADERFRDDTVDAGEIGSGHSVTALYEIKLHDKRPKRASLATLHLRYRSQATGEIVEIERSIRERDGARKWADAADALRLAAAVAEFGELLKGSYWAKEGDLDGALRVAQEAAAGFAGDSDVAELVGLIAKAAKLHD